MLTDAPLIMIGKENSDSVKEPWDTVGMIARESGQSCISTIEFLLRRLRHASHGFF